MTRNAQKQKRVVSKREYGRYLSRKVRILFTWSAVVFFMMLAFPAVLRGVVLPSSMPFPLLRRWEPAFKFCSISGFVLMYCAAIYKVKSLSNEFSNVEPVEPLTRHNVDRLPAGESLVRASSEPAVEQEKMLLRAAQATVETPAEQLLRPGAP